MTKELDYIESKTKQTYDNLEKPIEPEIYKPLNDSKNIQQNENYSNYEGNRETKLKELIKVTNERNNKKEKYIEDKLLEKYSKEVKDEIYKEEYQKIFNKIKNEISFKIREELLLKKQKEIEIKKKKFEYNNKKKLEEYQNILYRNIKEEYEISKIDIINLKINEYEGKYKKEFLNNKDKIKRGLIIEYQKMTNKLIEELEESKKNLMLQQNKEKMRIKQLDKIKGNYEEQEDYEKQRNEQINTMINNYRHFKMDNRRINIYPISKNKNDMFDNKKRIKKSNEPKEKKNHSFYNVEQIEGNRNKFILEKSKNRNGINIKEINNKLKKNNISNNL